ncbi:restriction endonuclease subunit S [Laribacter hongkongensis]|nr:restriction endonuclease subunit S [Laribacter hongkongensis]MCG9058790.1 restriction endonuclease subunit S [Laribacter hongkongensis]MCG9086698.1 restriction endonuclease subunit S [Laribacter hongkongensis]MCG9100318.1 restriction endonuclease subunit S [Laribacter hongkongensis]MCG9104029.1 restriction endonuclease subunit S [Laribacter hongkongensis]MCG9108080.1 restriction endonuclease subunit S [Laribacter hongkongensis]
MASEWQQLQLGKVCRKIGSGATPRGGKDAYRGGKTALIRSQNIYNDRFAREGLVYIDDAQAHELRNVVVEENDVLLNITGDSVARCCQVDPDVLPARVNQHVAIIRTQPDVLDARFLRYVLVAPAMQAHLLALASAGATRNALTKSMIESLTIKAPPISEQRAIAHILGTLDDKIELNRKQNETLEAMARALFKAWFVDFEPVRAKMEGRWQRGQSLPGLPAHLYDLFPDRLVESELGEIPEGWEMRSLDSIANYLNGLALQKFPPESETEFLPVIKIAQLRAGNTNGADKASTQIKPEYVVVDGDVLFSWSGSLEVEVWNGGRGALNQHLFKVTSNEVPKWFYFFATRQHLSDFRAIAAGKATTMGHIQRKHLTDARIAVAPPESMKKFDAVIASQFDQLVSNAQQSRSLAQLRDTLLPKLISGELRIKDAEAFLKERGL